MAAKTEKVIVKFVRDYVVDDARKGTQEEEAYSKGQRKSLPETSARHFVDRGIAVYVSTAKKG